MQRMPFTKKFPAKVGEQPTAENEKTGENPTQENLGEEGENQTNENTEQKNINPTGDNTTKAEDDKGKKVKF